MARQQPPSSDLTPRAPVPIFGVDCCSHSCQRCPKKYCVQPNNGIVAPRSTFVVLVSMQVQREAPLDMQYTDTFLVQSAVVSWDIAPKDFSGDLFTKESGNMVNEVKLKVVYAPPLQPASINEGSDQESLGGWSYNRQQENLQNQKHYLLSPWL